MSNLSNLGNGLHVNRNHVSQAIEGEGGILTLIFGNSRSATLTKEQAERFRAGAESNNGAKAASTKTASTKTASTKTASTKTAVLRDPTAV